MEKEQSISKKTSLFYGLFSAFLFAVFLLIFNHKIALLGGFALAFIPLLITSRILALNLFLIIFPFMPDSLILISAFGFLLISFIDVSIKRSHQYAKSTMLVPITLALLFMIVNTFTSVTVIGSLRDLAMNFAGFSMFVVVSTYIRTKEDFYKIMTSLAIGYFLVSVFGILQYKFLGTVNREWIDESLKDVITARAYSVFLNPNIFAEYLVLLSPLVAAQFWWEKDSFKKFCYLIILLIGILALLLTFSRGGLIALIFAVIVFLFLLMKPLLALIIPFGLLSLNFLPETIRNRILSITNLKDSSTSYRFKIWDITKDVVKDHPQIGVGFGHKPFKQIFEQYIRSMPIFHAHNTYLQMLAEGGAIGFIVFIYVAISLILENVRTYLKTKDNYIKIVAAGILSSVVGIMIHGIFEDVLYINRIILTIWLVMGISVSLSTINKSLKQPMVK